ncbi:ionotropic receptor 93a-like [Oratosquilla oratoria]|uniref:ionotropic receptor 93a-like n=1 Tax=Oratosquilla oratoria TaxID=337810 RepID=UPI003F76832A
MVRYVHRHVYYGQVWALVLLSAICVFLAFIFLTAYESKLFNLNYKNLVRSSAMWVIKALTQEGAEWLPKTDAARIVVATWIFASLVFMSSYSGILTAMLSAPKVRIPVDSTEDLLRQNKLPWRMEFNSMLYHYFSEATEGTRKEIYDRISGYYGSCWDIKENIKNREFAAFCDVISIQKAMSWDFRESGTCHMYMAREMVYSNILMAMPFRINSTYREPANDVLYRLKESGIFNHWLRSEITNATECMKPPGKTRGQEVVAPLNLSNFLGSFLLVLGGLGLGFLVFLIELMIATCKRWL